MLVFDIEQRIAEIGGNRNGTKELNLVSWNKAPARLDLRTWRTDDNGDQQPCKGITLTDTEAQALYDALGAYLSHERAG